MDSRGYIIQHRHYFPRLKLRRSWIDFIALIDIMFIILMFFVLSIGATKITGVSVELPKVSGDTIVLTDKYIISIVPSNLSEGGVQFFFGDELVMMNQLIEKLNNIKFTSKNPAIVIKADKKTPYDTVLTIMALVEQNGMPSFLVTDQEEVKTETKFQQ